MAWTVQERDALKAAIASGVLSVRFADRTIQYQSLQEMRALLAEMNGQLAAASGAPSYHLISTRKGTQ